MSADNWGICPKCKGNFKKELEKRVSDQKYSLREDFEIGIISDVFKINYSAYCECGFKYEFSLQKEVI